MAGEQNPPGKLTGHDMNTIAARVLASRGYLLAAGGRRAGALAGAGMSGRSGPSPV
jgi:hypothetical protein